MEGSGGSLAQSGDLEFFSKGQQQEEEEEGGSAGATTGSSRGGGLGREIHRVITSHAEAAKIGGVVLHVWIFLLKNRKNGNKYYTTAIICNCKAGTIK